MKFGVGKSCTEIFIRQVGKKLVPFQARFGFELARDSNCTFSQNSNR